MKKAALSVSILFVALALSGCKSDMEKAADTMCACADKKGDDAKKCMDDASKEFGDKMKGGKDDKTVKDMSDKDKEAFARAMGCAMKASGLGDGK